MKKQTAKSIQTLRIISQWIFTSLFLILFLLPLFSVTSRGPSDAWFFYFDPLLLVNGLILTKSIASLFLLSLVPLALTFVFGRFFCGWICPMGAIQHLFSRVFANPKAWKSGVDKKLLGIKYLVLVFIIVSASFGTGFITWSDPFSLLTRSLSSFLPKSISGQIGMQPLIVPLIFMFILAMNALRPRFFCNILCPLGALYGFVSRFGLFHLQNTNACTDCKKCASHCPYGGDAGKAFIKSECITCFNCLTDCPSEAAEVKFGGTAKEALATVNPGRRSFFGTLALGVAAAYLPKTGYSAKHGERTSFLRPPGSLDERSFLEHCQRCGLCIQACPTGFIRPAISEAGIEGVWTPVAGAGSGYCEWNCNKCTQVCPSGAIEKLDLKKKQAYRIGTAVIDKDLCYTYADGFNCTACGESCPLPQKALLFRDTETWNYQGRKVRVKQVYVDPDRCTGCGICVQVCPRTDSPGIYITSGDEYRRMPA